MTPTVATQLELLAPAKNLEIGKIAILAGADAVYIGAPAFGARASATNSISDISLLCDFAHTYGARVFVTLNTTLYEHEVEHAITLAHQLYEVGADALIVQDTALLNAPMPPIPLHGSTQMHNTEASKIAFWAAQGLEQIVVARELSPSQIAQIHQAVPNVRLEAFVHGALCVCYSGQCYASASINTQRSANRGNCSQVCRLPFNLVDDTGNVLVREQHLLSVKDLNRSTILPQLIEAGVTSFKIEGRLKDASYVQTVTAHYSRLLDNFITEHPNFTRRSVPNANPPAFTPDINAIFNRGYTTFSEQGRGTDDLANPATPKSIGVYAGKVSKITGNTITLHTPKEIEIHNGDGFTFFEANGATNGFRANTSNGNVLTVPRVPPTLTVGTTVYRSWDNAYIQYLQNTPMERKCPLSMQLKINPTGIKLIAIQPNLGISYASTATHLGEIAQKPQKQVIQEVLGKLGNTPYALQGINIECDSSQDYFIPRSVLAQLRRDVIAGISANVTEYMKQSRIPPKRTTIPSAFFPKTISYLANVSNSYARQFYAQNGAQNIAQAYELAPTPQGAVMISKYCIRYSIGKCPHLQHYKGKDIKHNWYLVNPERNLRFLLRFDCVKCQMLLFNNTPTATPIRP